MGCAKSKRELTSAVLRTGADSKPLVFFVLGGPGSGKGTQCQRLAQQHNFVHLSAGDLLRAERDSGSETATMINQYIIEGKIVPGEVTVGLMRQAIERNGWNKRKYLIDGFPRSYQNLEVWQKLMSDIIDVPFVLFLSANEDAMIARIEERSKTSGRSDDNMESLKKRFAVFKNESMPVVDYFDKLGKVRRVDALGSIDEVYA